MPIFNRITYGPVEKPEAYAVFDSSDGSFTFFRDTPGKYTDGQVSGTKMYYVGFEDITGTTNPSWYNSSSDKQKNTIKTVVFKDKISPKTCYDWFSNASSLASITGLDKLDTSAVTNMSRIFEGCSKLTSLDVSSFNTAAVTNMTRMFYNCTSLTSLNVSSFNTAKVTSMASMFEGCSKLTSLDVSSFNTENVMYMTRMFYNCPSLTSLDLSSFNTKNVTNMGYMFQNCYKLTSLDLSDFNTENVTSMSQMFYNCKNLTSLDVSSFNTAAVTNMGYMFNNCTSLTSLDVSSFNTAAVTNMGYMFQYCTGLADLDLSSFNTKNVTNMGYMFYNCTSLTSLNVSSFNTAKVTSMSQMFYNCKNLTSLDVSSFNTAAVTNIGLMFNSCNKLKTIYASSLFTTNAVSLSNKMFYGCTSLVGGAGTTYDANHTDKTYAKIDGGASNPGYFTERDPRQAYAVYDSGDQSMTFFRDTPGKYTDGQVSGTKTYYTGFEDITGTATPSWYDYGNSKQKHTIKTVVFKDKIKPKTCFKWFSKADSLFSITGLDKLDTAAVTTMDSMFYYCINLTSLYLSGFNTENVINMESMFESCSSLTSLDLSSFNTAKVTDMHRMFAFNSRLETIYASSLFTTDAVSSSDSMFYGCTSLVGGAGTTYEAYHTNKAYARIDGGTSNPGYFKSK